MKNIKHSLLAISMVALLSACGGAKEISYAEAKERTTHYSQEVVERQYSATKTTTTVEVAEATGLFGEGGLLASMIPEPGTTTETVEEVKIIEGFPSEEDIEKSNGKFFTNGQYGIKLTTWVVMEDEELPELEGKFEAETVVNDLGLMEYTYMLYSMTIEMNKGGIKLEGTARYSVKDQCEYVPVKNA